MTSQINEYAYETQLIIKERDSACTPIPSD
jgi:hypothetical protein